MQPRDLFGDEDEGESWAIMGHLIPTMMPIGSMVGMLLHGLIHWIRCPTSSRSCKGYLLCLALILLPSFQISFISDLPVPDDGDVAGMTVDDAVQVSQLIPV